jgi:hypothetical protein
MARRRLHGDGSVERGSYSFVPGADTHSDVGMRQGALPFLAQERKEGGAGPVGN